MKTPREFVQKVKIMDKKVKTFSKNGKNYEKNPLPKILKAIKKEIPTKIDSSYNEF